jgi:hypothetical protein
MTQADAKTLFALVAFDGRAPIEPETTELLERTLRTSEQMAIGFAVKIRTAPLVTAEEGTVIAIAIAGLPAAADEVRLTDRLELALQRMAARGSKIATPRNVAIAGLGPDQRLISDGIAALRHLLTQVGPGEESFGKILRLFTPPGIDSSKDPIARRAAARQFRTKLSARIKDVVSDATKG